MENCIFCKIIKGEIPSYKVRENDEFYAFLDAAPNCKGQTLVVPKKHYNSDIFLIEENGFYERFLTAAKTVAELLKRKLEVLRVWMVVEGLEVPHLHIKLYPMHGLDKPHERKKYDPVYFETYPWYITSLSGNRAKQEEQEKIAKLFK